MQRREPYPQRILALELRAAIDIARQRPQAPHVEKVRELIGDHPHGIQSRHVEHNLGEQRLYWLYENGLLPKPEGGVPVLVEDLRPA